jgi:hypothetical protein
MTRKQRDRMKSAVQEIARQLANFARRRKATGVEYNDSEHGFAGDGFPYFALRERIQINLDELGIRFVHAGGGVAAPTPEPPANE